jgi:phospholipid-binding lipoprotein MlaA
MRSIGVRAAVYLALLGAAVAACGPPASRTGVLRAPAGRPDNDPIESVNRKVFWFNDKVDVYVLEPVAKGWDRVAPDPVQRSVANFFSNIRFPIVFVNDVLQGKPRLGAEDVGRFAINTTVGVVGFFDYAARLGLEPHVEDFGQTLGWWGVPAGPYVVWPIIGPSNPRDSVGLFGDSAASIAPWFVDWYILAAARVFDTVNARAMLLETVTEAKRASFDYYSFVRNAYFQRRQALINDSAGGGTLDQESLYYPAAQEDLYHPESDAPPAAREKE